MPYQKAQEFHFVNSCKPGQNKEPQTRTLIRRHIAKSNLHEILRKQARSVPSSLATPGKRSSPEAFQSVGVQSEPSSYQSLLCACYRKLEDVIACSRASGHLLSVEECSICGRPRLLNVESTNKCDLPQQVGGGAKPPGEYDLISRLGAGRADPFASYAIAMKPYMHGLIDNVLQAIVPQMFPVNTKYPLRTYASGSFQLTISDPALLHATLAFSSFYFSASRGQEEAPKATIYHRGEAIRLMQPMLEDKEKGISDVMIGCVVKLSSFESCRKFQRSVVCLLDQRAIFTDRAQLFTGNFHGWIAHANALAEMVRRRGGLQNLGLEGIMKRQVYETDIMGSMIGGSQPFFAPIADDSPLYKNIKPVDMSMHLDSISTSDSAILRDTIFDSIASTSYLSAPLLRVLVRMHLLNQDLHAIEASTSFSPEMLLFTTKRTFIEYPLLSLRSPPTSTTPSTALGLDLGDLNEPIRLAALVYSNRVFRSFPPTSGVCAALLHQLRTSLERTNLSICWDPEHSGLLLWICCVAGVGTVPNKPIRTWFRALLLRVCDTMKIQSWEVCKWLLKGFLWHEGRLEKAAGAFWEEGVDCESFRYNQTSDYLC